MSNKKAHSDLDKHLKEAHKEGYTYGFIEGTEHERERIKSILLSVNAYALQVVLDTEAETYQAEASMDTTDLINLIDSEND